MARYKVVVRGTTPLVMNNPRQMRERTESLEVDIPVEKKLYLDPEGYPAIPAYCMKSALTEGAGRIPIPGKGKKTYKDDTIWALQVEPAYIRVQVPEKDAREAWEAFEARVKRGKSYVITARPMFMTWMAEFYIEVDPEGEELFPERVVREIVEITGKRVGILDGRKKNFGRFGVVEFERVE